MAKRNVWSGEETMELLEIIKENNAMQLFASVGRGQNEHSVYAILEDEMKQNGFAGKDASQIYHKWKNLKRAFYQSKKVNNGKAVCEFAEELTEILEQPCHPQREVPEEVPVELVEGAPAPVKKRKGSQPKTIRSQIITRLEKVQDENTDEFAKKYNDLYDYEFKLYKRKEKEQTAIFNRIVEQSKSNLSERCRQMFMSPIVQEEQRSVGKSNIVEIETIQKQGKDGTVKQFYQSLNFD